jgi:hypothetical protein
MKRFNLPVEWRNDVPIACVQMAERRTDTMIQFYGQHIRELSMKMLCASCYLQGIEDSWRTFGQLALAVHPILDYSI